jgi:hypothetical protein
MEDLKTIKERGTILTTEELIKITDNVCKRRNTTWDKMSNELSSDIEVIVIDFYETVNKEATEKILKIIEDGK